MTQDQPLAVQLAAIFARRLTAEIDDDDFETGKCVIRGLDAQSLIVVDPDLGELVDSRLAFFSNHDVRHCDSRDYDRVMAKLGFEMDPEVGSGSTYSRYNLSINTITVVGVGPRYASKFELVSDARRQFEEDLAHSVLIVQLPEGVDLRMHEIIPIVQEQDLFRIPLPEIEVMTLRQCLEQIEDDGSVPPLFYHRQLAEAQGVHASGAAWIVQPPQGSAGGTCLLYWCQNRHEFAFLQGRIDFEAIVELANADKLDRLYNGDMENVPESVHHSCHSGRIPSDMLRIDRPLGAVSDSEIHDFFDQWVRSYGFDVAPLTSMATLAGSEVEGSPGWKIDSLKFDWADDASRHWFLLQVPSPRFSLGSPEHIAIHAPFYSQLNYYRDAFDDDWRQISQAIRIIAFDRNCASRLVARYDRVDQVLAPFQDEDVESDETIFHELADAIPQSVPMFFVLNRQLLDPRRFSLATTLRMNQPGSAAVRTPISVLATKCVEVLDRLGLVQSGRQWSPLWTRSHGLRWANRAAEEDDRLLRWLAILERELKVDIATSLAIVRESSRTRAVELVERVIAADSRRTWKPSLGTWVQLYRGLMDELLDLAGGGVEPAKSLGAQALVTRERLDKVAAALQRAVELRNDLHHRRGPSRGSPRAASGGIESSLADLVEALPLSSAARWFSVRGSRRTLDGLEVERCGMSEHDFHTVPRWIRVPESDSRARMPVEALCAEFEYRGAAVNLFPVVRLEAVADEIFVLLLDKISESKMTYVCSMRNEQREFPRPRAESLAQSIVGL
ncbi:MAG: hypothetical protein SFY95_12100 [Planctomycetota bacterium]|nr:hypothetical protein [Planctomycetota bacterium]